MNYKNILSKKGINRTKFRTDLLDYFYSSNKSLSVDDIYIYFKSSINRVTIYRSLASFEKKGLIHKVPDSNNLKRYSLCREGDCNETSHNHYHGHFICHSCNQTFCLEDFKSLDTDITCLKGFYVQEFKLIAEGYCQICNQN